MPWAALRRPLSSPLAGALLVFALCVSPRPLLADDGPGASRVSPDLRPLLAVAGEASEAIEHGELERASVELAELHDLWERVEDQVRDADPASYAAIETAMGRSRAALGAEPPDARLAGTAVDSLMDAVEGFLNGTGGAAEGRESYGIADLTALLSGARDELREGETEEAAELLGELESIWPLAESEVRARSAEAYESMEHAMTEAAAALASTPVATATALAAVETMSGALEPLLERRRYSVWDAGFILLREGLEALLVIAALLATLRKSGRRDAGGWVWSGAAVGIAASVGLALLLGMALGTASSARAREEIEGIVGIASVLLMLTVGAWFHRHASIRAWDGFLKGVVGKALASGSLLSLAAVAFLAVFREGAETVVLYAAIAGGMATAELLTGVLAALLLLVAAGVLIIRLSVRLPIRAVFLVATILIHYLAFKILGESVHALQLVGALPVSSAPWLPELGVLGMYRSWQTFLPQIALVVVVAIEVVWNLSRRARQGTAQHA